MKRQLPRNIRNPWGQGIRQPKKDQPLTVLPPPTPGSKTPVYTTQNKWARNRFLPFQSCHSIPLHITPKEQPRSMERLIDALELKACGTAFLQLRYQSCADTMQRNCLKNVPSQQDLHRDFESTESWATGELITFYQLLSQHSTFFPASFLSTLLLLFCKSVYFTFDQGGSFNQGFFSAPPPPPSWLISRFLPTGSGWQNWHRLLSGSRGVRQSLEWSQADEWIPKGGDWGSPSPGNLHSWPHVPPRGTDKVKKPRGRSLQISLNFQMNTKGVQTRNPLYTLSMKFTGRFYQYFFK